MADKKQSKTDFRAMTEQELQAKLASLRADLVEHRKANAMQELPNPAVIAKTRKDIAKTLTILGEARKANAAATTPEVKEQEK